MAEEAEAAAPVLVMETAAEDAGVPEETGVSDISEPEPEPEPEIDDRAEEPASFDTSAAIRAADAAIATAIASARAPEPEDEAVADVEQTPDTSGEDEMTDERSASADDPPQRSDADDEPAAEPETEEAAPVPPVSVTPVDPLRPVDAATDAPVTLPAAERTEAGNGAFEGRVLPPVHGQNLIDGRWRDASEDRLLPVINPSDGETIGYIARGTAGDIDQAIQAAHRAMNGPWGRMPAFERGRILAELAKRVLDHADHLARLEARDVGKPLRQARADAIALARYFEFYGGAADKVHGQTIPYHDGYTVLTLREPHGVTGHIVPWNYPMQIIGRSVGAALAMGNAAVLKPGEDASLTALEIGRLALEAGLPPGVLNIVTGLGEEAGAALAAHPGVDHLSFTGSVATGRLVQQAAATHTCPVTLELGGKSPQIVFADADLDVALPFLVNGAIQNAGQTCSAGSRACSSRTGSMTRSLIAWPSASTTWMSAPRNVISIAAR